MSPEGIGRGIGTVIEPSDRAKEESKVGTELREKLPQITADISKRLARLEQTMLSGDNASPQLGFRAIAKAQALLTFLEDIGAE